MRLLFTLIFFLATHLAFAATEAEYAAKNYAGADNFAIVKNATQVTACTLTPDGDPKNPKTWKNTDDPNRYLAGATAKIPKKLADDLRKILLNPALDNPMYYGKGCAPIYHVRLTFPSKAGRVDVALCFYCDIFSVSRDGKEVGGGSFDEYHDDLVALCRGALPKDPALAWLQKNHPQSVSRSRDSATPSQNSQK